MRDSVKSDFSSKAFAKRLAYALDLRNYPPLGRGRIAYLQEVFKLSRAGANKWMHGQVIPHRKARQLIADKLGVSLHWLETGEGDPLQNIAVQYDAQRLAKQIPLINLAQAFTFNQSKLDSENHDFIVVGQNIPERVFAVKHVGESMLPRFHSGSILIVDPQQPLRDGDYVLAKSNRIPEAIFRQYLVGANATYLAPFNSRFETIEISNADDVIGKVIEVRTEVS